MSNTVLTISPSPHLHQDTSVSQLMYGVLIALMPTFAVGIYYFGIGAVRVTLISILACMVTEWLIAKYLMKKESSLIDGSAIITGSLLAFNLPANLPWWMIIIGSIIAIGIGKMAFGGLGNNPFNPALVGRVFLLISFPVDMTSWPVPVETRLAIFDAATGATPLAMIKEGVGAGQSVAEVISSPEFPSYFRLLLGNMGGCIGEVSALALIIGFIYMVYKKIITWHIPVITMTTIFALTGIMWFINPDKFADPVFHVLSGGALLGAIFMATDYVSSPMTVKGVVLYAFGIGFLTVIIRLFGAYPEGMSFAILIMNAFVPLINKYIKPKRFGKVKNG